MALEVKVPVLPESVSDATIASWHKKPGDTVKRDENLVDLETDKVVLEVPAPADGVLKEIKQQQGATVTSQQLLAIIEEGATATAAATPAPAAATQAPPRLRPLPLPLPRPRRSPLNFLRRANASPARTRSIRRKSPAPVAAARSRKKT